MCSLSSTVHPIAPLVSTQLDLYGFWCLRRRLTGRDESQWSVQFDHFQACLARSSFQFRYLFYEAAFTIATVNHRLTDQWHQWTNPFCICIPKNLRKIFHMAYVGCTSIMTDSIFHCVTGPGRVKIESSIA